MKRFSAAAMLLILLFIQMPWGLADSGEGLHTSDVFTYSLGRSGSVVIVSVSKSAEGIVCVPETLDGHPALAIGDEAFSGCNQITQVLISEGVQHIGSRAFLLCEKLAYVFIPASLDSMTDNPFAGCSALKTMGYERRKKYMGQDIPAELCRGQQVPGLNPR